MPTARASERRKRRPRRPARHRPQRDRTTTPRRRANPPLLELIAELTGTTEQLEDGAVHPVVFGGWVGMLVTLLNLLPVGQLDGGHVLRAMVGERARAIAAAVPGALFALAGYLLFVVDGVDSVGIWLLWG
ncbi:hypothetical protein BRC62_03655, partial [Halobacteriales archaeon QH_10_67_13]